MNVDQYRDFLLSRIPTASIASGGRVINCKCFYCPDSRDPKTKHFYISMPQSDDEPSLYYCHKCHCSGMVTYKKLIEWNIYDDGIANQLIDQNSKASRITKYAKWSNNIHYNLNHQYTTENEISAYKLNYINNRIGTNYSYKDLRDLKIILNLKDLLNENRINIITRNQNIVDQLDINFLGFLSIDNAFLNMRRICDEGLVYKSIDKRYINYKIFDKNDTSERFYTIPTRVNLLTPNRTKIHVAEGPFDILSIYENLRHREEGIYTSIAGSNYIGIASYFLEMYRIPYVEFHYYPDNDKFGSNYNMKKVADYLKYMNIPIYVHRNLSPGEKDFGVHPSRIKEYISTVDLL
jgi:hypothetical protein